MQNSSADALVEPSTFLYITPIYTRNSAITEGPHISSTLEVKYKQNLLAAVGQHKM